MKIKRGLPVYAFAFMTALTVLTFSACSQSTTSSIPQPSSPPGNMPVTASSTQTNTPLAPPSSAPAKPSPASSVSIASVEPPLPVSVAVDETVRADKTFDGKTVNMAPKGSLQVTLESNPTTGYRWELTGISDSGVLQEAGHTYDTPTYKLKEGEQPPLGAGGMEFWNFTALKKGTATLTMDYNRSFDPATKGEKTFSLTVIVE